MKRARFRKRNLTAQTSTPVLAQPGESLSLLFETMTKEELEKYARENRKRLDEQEVKLGDVIKVLVGQFAGETGVIVSISACRNDYTDPYYEADMNCEVPDKYKCRKTLISPNNVIGGLSATDFEVIGNRAPKQPTMEIEQGDRVRVSKDAPRIYTPDWVDAMFDLVLKVTEVEDGNAMVEFEKRTQYRTVLTAIPTKYLVKVDAEKNSDVGSIRIPVEVDLSDDYWDAYTADLAKELAVKIVNKKMDNCLKDVGAYAVSVAKAVVEGLKGSEYETERPAIQPRETA